MIQKSELLAAVNVVAPEFVEVVREAVENPLLRMNVPEDALILEDVRRFARGMSSKNHQSGNPEKGHKWRSVVEALTFEFLHRKNERVC